MPSDAEKRMLMESERLDALEARVTKIEKASWVDAIKPYLPELRSLVWMTVGLLGGGGTAWYAKPTPPVPAAQEIVVNPGQVKAQMPKSVAQPLEGK